MNNFFQGNENYIDLDESRARVVQCCVLHESVDMCSIIPFNIIGKYSVLWA
jgi:hypothetical protein